MTPKRDAQTEELRQAERALWLAEEERKCRALWLAVLGQAAQDTVAHWDLQPEDQAEAVALFEEGGEALEALCDLAGVVPDRVLKAYRRGELADFSLSAIGRKRYESRRKNKARRDFAQRHGVAESRVLNDLLGDAWSPDVQPSRSEAARRRAGSLPDWAMPQPMAERPTGKQVSNLACLLYAEGFNAAEVAAQIGRSASQVRKLIAKYAKFFDHQSHAEMRPALMVRLCAPRVLTEWRKCYPPARIAQRLGLSQAVVDGCILAHMTKNQERAR